MINFGAVDKNWFIDVTSIFEAEHAGIQQKRMEVE
jgi:hypothetical protein